MPERDGKDQGGDSPKQAGSCWFARPCRLATSGGNLYPPGVWFADVMTSFSGVKFFSFCFASFLVFMLSLKPRPFVQGSSICRRPDSRTCFFIFSLCLFGEIAFSDLFIYLFLYHCCFLLVWRVRRTFFPSGWCFFTL